MPYLPTSQAFLEQSAQLLEAYPDTVRQFHTYIHVQSDKLQYNPSRTTHPSKPPHCLYQHKPTPSLPLQQQPKPSGKNQLTPPQTRITTKYHFPTETPGARAKRAKSQAKKASTTSETTSQPATTQTNSAPVASLTLKTYNPTTGIVLQYQTNKIAEVSRLITGLGKLASGADVASLGFSGAGQVGGDVEMVDAPTVEEVVPAAAAAAPAAGQSGKGKKKGGKGKR